MSDAAAPADLGMTQLTPAEASAKLDSLTADPAWTGQLFAGNGPTVREFQDLVAKKFEGNPLDHIVAGTPGFEPPMIETVTDGKLSTRNQMISAAALRDIGVSPEAIKQAFSGQQETREVYDAVKNLKADRLGDKEWVAKLLAGDRAAVREMMLMNIVLVNGFQEKAA